MARLNLLYLFGNLESSKWENNEIRYSLRSMSTTNDVDWVGITGPAVPSFFRGICHIKCELRDKKFVNLVRQLHTAMSDKRVPEDLILMNDDFFMRTTPAWDWTPTFMDPPTNPRNKWQKSIALTLEYLRAAHRRTDELKSYEGHTPMPIKKSLALQTLDEILPHVESGHVMQFRTAYGNMHKIGGNKHTNAKHKTLEAWPADSPFLSLTSNPADELKDYIISAWPKPSRWEV